jgi:hypothetical protein
MSISKRLALYDELDRRLSEVLPDQYTIPDIDGIPHGCRELGAATDRMKQLWTVWARLEEEKCLGESELLKRAAHVAISFEIGKHFNCWRARIGINSSWRVYAVTSN